MRSGIEVAATILLMLAGLAVIEWYFFFGGQFVTPLILAVWAFVYALVEFLEAFFYHPSDDI